MFTRWFISDQGLGLGLVWCCVSQIAMATELWCKDCTCYCSNCIYYVSQEPKTTIKFMFKLTFKFNTTFWHHLKAIYNEQCFKFVYCWTFTFLWFPKILFISAVGSKLFVFTMFFCRSKLRVEDLREMQQANKEASWASDKDATNCKLCEKPFSVARRKVGIVMLL